MRALIVFSLGFSMIAFGQPASKPAGGKKDPKVAAPLLPKGGIKSPGVQIPFASLKPEAELPSAPHWMFFADAPLVPNFEKKSIDKIDAKANTLGSFIAAINQPCGGAISAFKSLWVPICGDKSIARIDPKTGKITKTLSLGAGVVAPQLAASADSVWAFTDDKTTLSRIDPDQDQIVADFRIPADCNSITFGETALWITCPAEDRVLRINPALNIVEKSIETSASPRALVIGEASVWVLCEKDGKIDRIDPKTNKVSKSIELGAPAVGGGIADGLGSLWVTVPGFPLTRIDTAKEKVIQQFYGEGGGAIYVGQGSLWLSNLNNNTLWRIDPKRVAATLAE
jgi:streptogramin lyase